MLINAIIIVQLCQQFSGIHFVDPVWHLIDRIIRTFSGNRIAQYDIADGLPAKQPDIKFFHRAYPVRRALVVDLKKDLVVKNIRRIAEA